MFRLKLLTDPRWANIAEENLEEILTDHAWCEQKAATNAIGLITMVPEYTEMVTELLAIAQEELEHFGMVHDIIKKRWRFGTHEKRRLRQRFDQILVKAEAAMNRSSTKCSSLR